MQDQPKTSEARKNPRFHDKSFNLKVTLPNRYEFAGIAYDPSAYGATVEISEHDFNYLNENNSWWENESPLRVSTTLNDLPACINNLKCSDGVFIISIKLLGGLNWYSSPIAARGVPAPE